MFNVELSYPDYNEELQIVKSTTVYNEIKLNEVISSEEIIFFQNLIAKLPITDNLLNYAVKLVTSTRPNNENAPDIVKDYIEWGAGFFSSQYIIKAAKCHAAIKGKYSPDIEDVKAVAEPILMHRMVKNYKAEAEEISINHIIKSIL